MTLFVDTNVLIRHVTGDPAAMAQRATATLGGRESLLVTDVVFAECVFVLETYYDLARSRVAELLGAALALPAVATLSKPLLLRALEVYEGYRLDFVDSYLVAQAELTGVGKISSFDRSIDRVASVTRREP